MHCLIVAGGAADDLPTDVSLIEPFEMVVCADGGIHNALRLGLQPQVVIGDLDSLDPDTRDELQAAGCRFFVHPVDKDETDLELALLWCREAGATKATVIGAFGGRLDHTVANLLLLSDTRFADLSLSIRSRDWEVWLVRHDIPIRGKPGDTVSLIPLSERVEGIRTQGLRYPLHGEALVRGPARGVSNVMLNTEAHVHIESGILIIMHGPFQAAGSSAGHGKPTGFVRHMGRLQ